MRETRGTSRLDRVETAIVVLVCLELGLKSSWGRVRIASNCLKVGEGINRKFKLRVVYLITKLAMNETSRLTPSGSKLTLLTTT